MTEEPWLSTAEAAHRLGMHHTALIRLCKRYRESGGTEGLRCRWVGEGHRLLYTVDPAAVAAYQQTTRRGRRPGAMTPEAKASMLAKQRRLPESAGQKEEEGEG